MMGMPDELRLRFQIHSTLPVFQRRVARARSRIEEWLAAVRNPYVAFSGGKDSTCVLHLVREQRPETPAVYLDADCCFPEVDDLLQHTPNLIRYPTSEPFLVTLARYGVDDPRIGNITMRTTVYEPVEASVEEHGFDGTAYGLRAEESRGRRLHARSRGAIFRYKKRYGSLLACQPIWDWTYDDVWAFIVVNQVPYAGTYDRMWHMAEREQRVSYWAGETNRSRGRYAWLRQNYPDLFRRLSELIPEVKSYV